MKKLLFEELILENREEFKEKLIEISEKLGIKPDDLMLVFYIETAAAKYKVINHRIQNSIKATGYIQFMPATAKELGTTTTALKNMSNVEQLNWVYKYLLPYKGKMKSVTDVYLAVFFPAAIGKSDDWVLQTPSLSAAKIAAANPGYAKNGQIKVKYVKEKVLSFIPKGYEI